MASHQDPHAEPGTVRRVALRQAVPCIAVPGYSLVSNDADGWQGRRKFCYSRERRSGIYSNLQCVQPLAKKLGSLCCHCNQLLSRSYGGTNERPRLVARRVGTVQAVADQLLILLRVTCC